ncbi:MAG: PDZ domain-containing protein [Candidatus Coatesbacteria bacterium]|nr:PDZ domain-containing protein [Candidatus Coatesbacteria bacterium]
MFKKRISRWAIVSAVGLFLAILCLAQTPQMSHLSEMEAYFPYLSTLVQTLRTIDEFYVDEINMEELLRQGTMRLVTGLDARSEVIFPGDNHGRQADLGLNIMVKDGLFVVISREVNSPAFESEIEPGDKIVGIDDHSVRGLTLDELRRELRGDPGTQITLTLYGPKDFKVKKVELKRAVYSTQPASFSLDGDGILTVTFRTFADGVSKTFKKALSRADGKKLKGIIIDVRDNIGGSINEVVEICSRFIAFGPVFMRANDTYEKEFRRDDSISVIDRPVPLVIVVNERTLGEAEVLAASLRAHKFARLVGQVTFGFALSTECINTTGGTKVILATSKYLGPFGQKIHEVGLTPDVIAAFDKDSDADTQMAKAREAILNWTPIDTDMPETGLPESEKEAA